MCPQPKLNNGGTAFFRGLTHRNHGSVLGRAPRHKRMAREDSPPAVARHQAVRATPQQRHLNAGTSPASAHCHPAAVALDWAICFAQRRPQPGQATSLPARCARLSFMIRTAASPALQSWVRPAPCQGLLHFGKRALCQGRMQWRRHVFNTGGPEPWAAP
jgi:hypothetical protein